MFLIVLKCGCGLDCHRNSATSSHSGCVGKHRGVQCVVKSCKWSERKSKYGPDSLPVDPSSHSCGVPSHEATAGMLWECHLWHMRVYTCRAPTDRLDSLSQPQSHSIILIRVSEKRRAHPPCLLRLDFISCLSPRGLSSLPALISSAFVGNDTDWNGALHTVTACLYCSSNPAIIHFFHVARAWGFLTKTCNYLLNTAKTPGGGGRARQDKEKVDLWNKCLLSSAACRFRSNNDLCLRLEHTGDLNQRKVGREVISLCWLCRGASGWI